MMKKFSLGFHGDVNLIRVDALPPNAKRVNSDDKFFVLAEGEATQHKHIIKNAEDLHLYKSGDRIFLKPKKDVLLAHKKVSFMVLQQSCDLTELADAEHDTVVVPGNVPGNLIYEVLITREKDWLTEQERKVVD